MADQTNESILFEIKINSSQYQAEQKLIRDSLGQIALHLEKTRAAQKALNDERKAGKITDEQYATQSVKLREQLKGQMADQRELEKGLATSQKAYNSAAGSAEQLRAQLFELKTAYYAMSEAERQSAEGQGLQKQALSISDTLSTIEKSVGTASRDVGKYGEGFKQGLAGVVAELVKAKAAQQNFAQGSEDAARNQIKVNGFQTAAQRAAAQAGITDFTQAKAVIDQYTQAFTPAVENLVQLQQEQQRAGETVGENSEQYQQLGFKIAGAQKQLDDLVSAQQAAEQASRAGGAAAQGQAGAVEVAANSLGGLRLQLIALKEQRETLDPTTREAEELNAEILTLDTRIQQAAGKIDEFGERVQKNIKKENFDTVNDAIQGLVGTMSAATIVFGDNTDAAAAQAKALQLMALAQNARAIAIGLDSAKDAAQIVLLKAKGLFLKEEATLTAAAAVSTEAHAAVAGADATAIEAQAGAAALNAEGQAASAEATVASTVATEAQVVATEGATIAQRALNVAMRLNPIGFIIIAVAALVSLFAVYRNASEQTRQKIRDITEAFLRFSNPIGLVYTGIEKLYERFESVRRVLAPLVAGFEKLAGVVAKDARALGEWVGLLDTAAQKAAKLAEQQVALGEATTARIEAEARSIELAGALEEQVRAKQRTGMTKRLDDLYDFATKQDALDKKELDRIAKKQQAQQVLSDKEKEFLQKSAERSQKVLDAENALDAFDRETIERKRVARIAEATDIESNSQRAAATYRRRLEEGIANEKAALQQRINILDRGLAVAQLNSAEELDLQRKRIATQRDLELLNLGPTLAQERALRKQNLGSILADQTELKKIELSQFGLTQQQKQHIETDYRNKAADTRLAFSTAEAERELKARQDIVKNAAAADLRLTTDHLRQISIVNLQAEQERNTASLALNGKAQAERASQGLQATKQQLAEQYQLQSRAAVLERELALASLATRTDNVAAELRIRAEANQKLAALDAAQADATRQRHAKELTDEAQYYNLLADGMLAGHTQAEQAQVQATETYKQQRIAAVFEEQDARLALVAKGSQEEVNIRQETENKLRQIQQDSSHAQLEAQKEKYARLSAVVQSSVQSLGAIQQADANQRIAQIEAEENRAGVSAARKAVLEKQKLRVEQQAAEQRKKLAKAEAVVNLAAAVMQILKSPTAPFVEPAASVVRGLEIAAATAAAYAQFRAIDSAKFAAGGIVQGPSHSRGGVQMWHRSGAHLGEMEGGEAIMSVGAVKKFGGLLSHINVLGGGKPFAYLSQALAIPARYAEGGVVSSSAMHLPAVRSGGIPQAPAPTIDYEALADVLAARLAPAFVAGARALPAQNVNLTELRERNTQLDQRNAQTNI
jgi:hypothetical protein